MTIQILDFKVSLEDVGKRLDKFLSEKLSDLSRSHIQSLILNGSVLIFEKKREKKYLLKEGDEVKVFLEGYDLREVLPDASVKFDVVFDSDDFLIINKPAGLVVHPNKFHKTNTLVNGLLAKFPNIKDVGEDSMRPGIVHRLDKDTSGIMIIAKNQDMFLWLKEQFKEKKVKKRYLALVFGGVRGDGGEIVAPIAKSNSKQVALIKGKRVGRISSAKEAITIFKVKDVLNGFTLLDVFPKTGRTHQIRVHLASINHPIVGDKKYSSKKLLKTLPFKRQFLHAYYLSFFLKNGKRVEFSVGLPKDLSDLLKTLAK